MIFPKVPRASRVHALLPLLGAAAGLFVTAPARAGEPARARLVRCGGETCLKLSGRHASPVVAVRIRGEVVPMAPDRAWALTVPLARARPWVSDAEQGLTVELTDAENRQTEATATQLPPGAFGRRRELAMLVVTAR